MRSPYCIGVWKPSLSEGAKWVSDHFLGDNVIQFKDDPKRGVWVLLRITGDQATAIQESPDTTKVIG